MARAGRDKVEGEVLKFLESLSNKKPARTSSAIVASVLRAGLVALTDGANYRLTDTGLAWLRRNQHPGRVGHDIDGFRAQHLELAVRKMQIGGDLALVTVDDGESPLGWLARRKGRDGRALIDAVQFSAGERLRADFTKAQLTPRITSNWSSPGGGRVKGGGPVEMTDMILASRQRVNQAMKTVGPEFAGILLDVCCFLRGLEDVEKNRGWPSRSAKVVLQLGLDCLARHYGFAQELKRGSAAPVRTWLADDANSGVKI